MTDKELICIMAAIIFASPRETLNNGETDEYDAAEAVACAHDIVEAFETPASEMDIDTEPEILPPAFERKQK